MFSHHIAQGFLGEMLKEAELVSPAGKVVSLPEGLHPNVRHGASTTHSPYGTITYRNAPQHPPVVHKGVYSSVPALVPKGPGVLVDHKPPASNVKPRTFFMGGEVPSPNPSSKGSVPAGIPEKATRSGKPKLKGKPGRLLPYAAGVAALGLGGYGAYRALSGKSTKRKKGK